MTVLFLAKRGLALRAALCCSWSNVGNGSRSPRGARGGGWPVSLAMASWRARIEALRSSCGAVVVAASSSEGSMVESGVGRTAARGLARRAGAERWAGLDWALQYELSV